MLQTRVLEGRKILVVDDSKDMTSLLADIFSDAGAQVTEANRGEDAIRSMADDDFDVVFLDLTMPEPDGWKMLQFMRGCLPHLLSRTIVLTAHANEQEESRLLKDIHVAYMFKPFMLADLVGQARRAILGTRLTYAAAQEPE
jgi:DNA-binding response OmpR family regulator